MGGGYVNKQPKTTKLETLNNKSIYKKLALLFVAVFLVASVYFKTSSARYKVTQEVQIVNGNIKANLDDLNAIAIYVDGEKQENNQVPNGNYEIDEENTKCTVNGAEVEGITFEYKAGKIGVYGISQGKMKCNFYLKKKKLPTDAITDQVISDAAQPDLYTSCINGTNNGYYAPDSHNCGEEANGIYAEETSLGTTYYFRGTVNNNWVKFGKMNETKEVWAGYDATHSYPQAWYSSESECNAVYYIKTCTKAYSSVIGDDIWWRIIRINEDGTVRLIYAGTGDKENVTSSNTVNGDVGYWMTESYGINNTGYEFNTDYSQNAYVGFMYGIPGSTSYEEEHQNITSSNVKTELDKWYEANLKDEGDVMLSGSTGFCGDRSIADYDNGGTYTNKGYGKEKTFFKAFDRLANYNSLPSYDCPNPGRDLYTTSSDPGQGNGALTYPIGLITTDDSIYAGGGGVNYGYWLYTGQIYWTITPHSFSSIADVFCIDESFGLMQYELNRNYGLFPVVNLKPEYLKTAGHDGTIDNPYIASLT